jgi:hypothetical protein
MPGDGTTGQSGGGKGRPGKDLYPGELEWSLMSKRTVKRKLRAKKKANHGKKPNCGRG